MHITIHGKARRNLGTYTASRELLGYIATCCTFLFELQKMMDWEMERVWRRKQHSG